MNTFAFEYMQKLAANRMTKELIKGNVSRDSLDPFLRSESTMVDGLNVGSHNIANKYKVPIHEMQPGQLAAYGGGLTFPTPIVGGTRVMVEKGGDPVRRAVVLRHEVDEARAMADPRSFSSKHQGSMYSTHYGSVPREGLSGKIQSAILGDVHVPQGGAHADPRVLVREHKNVMPLSKNFAEKWKGVRDSTGENGFMSNHTGGAFSVGEKMTAPESKIVKTLRSAGAEQIKDTEHVYGTLRRTPGTGLRSQLAKAPEYIGTKLKQLLPKLQFIH